MCGETSYCHQYHFSLLIQRKCYRNILRRRWPLLCDMCLQGAELGYDKGNTQTSKAQRSNPLHQ